jgi:hypothetical protein
MAMDDLDAVRVALGCRRHTGQNRRRRRRFGVTAEAPPAYQENH